MLITLLDVDVTFFSTAIAITPTSSSATIRVRNFKNSYQDGEYNFLQGYYKAQWSEAFFAVFFFR